MLYITIPLYRSQSIYKYVIEGDKLDLFTLGLAGLI
jgi:hypothetical protein